MENPYPGSKVLIQGWMARWYDNLLDIFTLGFYTPFLKRVIRDIGITEDDRILDFGAGTGKNACLMRKYLGTRGYFLGLDVSDDMIQVFKKRCRVFKNVEIKKQGIDKPFHLGELFTKVFISFVLHGFPQDVRMVILKNAFNHLEPGGSLFIFDYGEFRLSETSFIFKKMFKMIECIYAFDFIERNLEEMLKKTGFREVHQKYYLGGKLRLVNAIK